MNADPLWAEFSRDVADGAFKSRFGHTHDVVVLNDHLAAVV